MTRKALGRGLEALIPVRPQPAGEIPQEARTGAATLAHPDADTVSRPRTLPVDAIGSNPYQPRQRFDEEALQELAASIQRSGLLQPLLVRPHDGAFQLVAGERRLRAARLAGLQAVPVHVLEVADTEMLRLALLENVQRQDLNPIEEAQGYQRLMDEFGMSQPEIATQIGKSRSAVTNTLRLLQLPAELRQRVETGELSSGHARALLGADTIEAQSEIAELVRARGLTVREVERITQERRRATRKPAARRARLPELAELQKRLEARVGTRVRIRARKADGSSGRVEIEYYGTEDLERIFQIMGAEYEL